MVFDRWVDERRPQALRRVPAAIAAVTLGMALTPAVAFATFPGALGRIAFSTDRFGGDREIATMNPNGSDFKRLTFHIGDDTEPTYSPNGRWILFTRRQAGEIHIWKMRPSGADRQRVTKWNGEFSPTWAPTGRRFAFGMGSQIWSARIDGTHVHQVTSGPGINENPDWAPSGNWIAFDHQTPPVGDVGGDDDITKIRPNGTDRAVLTPTSIYFDGLPSWSPDSQRVAFQRTPNSNRDRIDIYSVAASGTGIKPLVATSSDEVTAAYSPTGTQVAYASPEIPASGNFDIWRSVIASGMRQRLTFNPGFDTQPDWQALP